VSRRNRRFLEKTIAGFKPGSFVSWPSSNGSSRGRVVSTHTGKVPGVIGAHTATTTEPAARVQLYVRSGNGWEPTSVHLAHPTSALTALQGAPSAPTETPKMLEAVVASGSFDDIRTMVQDAICDQIEMASGIEPDGLYVYDIGAGWAVYRAGWDADLQMVEYTLAADGTVTIGAPIEVYKVTTYVTDNEAAEPSEMDSAPLQGGAGTNTASTTSTHGVDGAVMNDGVFAETVRHEGRLLASMGTDTTGGRVFEVHIIRYGDSKNGRRYPADVMRKAAHMYEGAKAYDHHRTDQEINTGTTVGIIGHYRNVEATDTGIKGELHLLPSATHTAELLDQTLANQAAGLPPLVGISHDVMTQWKPITVGNRQFREVTAIIGVNSADVVSDPAAGGAATRMVAGIGDPTTPTIKEINVTLKQLLDLLRAAESAKRPALLAEHAHLIESFGFTIADFAREVESVHTAPLAASTTPTRDTEAAAPKYAKASLTGRSLVKTAIDDAGIDGRLAESVTADLPEQFTEAELVAEVARAKRLLEASTLAPTVKNGGIQSNVSVRFDSLDKKKAALDAFFAQDWRNGYTSFKEAYIDITGANPRSVLGEDFNRQILRESAGDTTFYDSMRSTESVVSSTWSNILGDSVTRHMVAEYSREEFNDWQQIVTMFPINDFRTQRVDRLGDYAVLPTVNQGAPYQPLVTPGNEEATYAPAKRGGTEDLTLETIANDDIRVISRIPQRLGIAAAETIFKFVMDFFIAPITTTYDSTATFAAGHGNTDGNVLNDTNLSLGWAKMLKQTALNGSTSFLPVQPKFLLIPPDLRQMGLVLCQSAVAVPSGIAGASNIPNVNQGLIPIIVPYWTATSTTGWFLVADPSRTPGIEIGMYQGKAEPDLFVQSDQTIGSMFDADKLTFKIRHIYGGTVVDHRGLYRGNS
jgi:hypothetical protein